MRRSQIASLGLLLIAIIWGVAFIMVDYALNNGYKTFTILALRGLIAGLILSPFAIKYKVWRNKKNLLHSIIAGTFFFLGYATQTIGQEKTDVIHSAFYTCLYVIFTPFIVFIITKKRFGLKTFLGALLALIGIFFLNFIAKGAKFSFNLNDIYLILCAVFFALQIVWLDLFITKDTNPMATSSIMLLTMGILATFCIPLFKESLPPSIKGFGGILFASLFSSGLCSVLQFYCQRYVPSSTASLLMSLETVFACLFSALFGYARLNLFTGIGLFFMMMSVFIVEFNFKKKIDLSNYEFLLFDVDDTILDFHKAEIFAFKMLFKAHHLKYRKKYYRLYSKDNLSLWKAYERNEISRKDIFDNRFKHLFGILKTDVDPVSASYEFLKYLALGGFVLDKSDIVLAELKKKYKIYIISNGEPEVQYPRLKQTMLYDYFDDIFISKEIGASKPNKAFFDYVASHITGFDNKKALVIGDSLSSDILGAKNYNIDSVWYNPKYEHIKTDANYIINSLDELI